MGIDMHRVLKMYSDRAIQYLKGHSPTTIYEFQRVHALCMNKILSSFRLCRCMSVQEAEAWGRISPPGSMRISSDLSGLLNPSLLETMWTGESRKNPVILKWFSFDRPYLFKKYNVNENGIREGQEFLMTLPLTFEIKAALIKRLLADVSVQALPSEMKANSCRGKVEGGTLTLGISLPLIERISGHLTIEKLGHRLFI